ncbi:lysozyme-like domain-containing protein, partial [Coemansia spiralis]
YGVVKTYTQGTDVSISCQAPGTNINGDSLWDKIPDGCYVSDYYVSAGSSTYVAQQCSSGSEGSGGGSGSGSYCKSINQVGISLITEFEGFVASPSPDPIGLPTVGYGHLCQTKGCSEVKYKLPLTTTTALELLSGDLPTYTKCLASYLNSKVSLSDNQWAALTSWVFNVGCGNAQSSTLVKRLNSSEGPNTVASQELPKWRLAGGEVLPGLVRRRAAEVKLFITASSKKAHPSCE